MPSRLAKITDGIAGSSRTCVERLESRQMLSTVTWINTTGGSWSTAANWSTHALPKSGDNVVINKPNHIKITLSSSVSISSLALTGDILTVSSGAKLTTAGAFTNGGTVTVNPGSQLSVGGSYTESAGATLSMPGTGAGVVAKPSKVTAHSVSNSGVIVVGPNNTLTSNTTFTQTSTGTLDVQLGGTPTSMAFGFIVSLGAAKFGGILKSEIVYGYAPTTTDTFVVMKYLSETGSFSSYTLAGSASSKFTAALTFTNITLASAPTASLTATVNAAANLRAVKTSLLGVNVAWFDGLLGTSQTQQLLGQAGLNLFRFPSGSSADQFHFNIANNLGVAGAQTIPQFAKDISSFGGTGMGVLDYGSGSPQEAAAELAYLIGSPADTTTIGTGIVWNGTTSSWQNVNWGTVAQWASLRAASPLATNDGYNFLRIAHPASFANLKYWEIGNEEYGAWEIDHHGTPAPGGISTGAQHDPATYVAFGNTFSTFANEITSAAGLPNISIGIDSQNPTGLNDNNFTRKVFSLGAAIGFIPNYISDHNYAQGPFGESDANLLNHSVSDPSSLIDWNVRYTDYESILKQVLSPAQASSVQIMATEFNSVNVNPGKQSTSLVNGLYVADSLGSLLNSGYSAALVWDLRNGFNGNSLNTTGNNSEALYGWRLAGDYGLFGSVVNQPPATGAYIPYPNYFAELLASKMILAGGEVESASSNYQDLHVYAVKEANGHLELMVINTNPAASLTERFNLSGFQSGGAAQIWQYGKTQDTAQSKSPTGASSLANFNTTLSVSGGGFSYTLPAYSMTVIELTPA